MITSTIFLQTAAGWFYTTDIHAALTAWATVAERDYASDLPADTSTETVDDWAREVIGRSFVAEGQQCPSAAVRRDGEILELSWAGTWTPGRTLTVTIGQATVSGAPIAVVAWETGTGKPSVMLTDLLATAAASAVEWGDDTPVPRRAHSMARQAQSLAKACFYHDQAGREPERTPHGCGGAGCEWCADFPGTEWRAESDRLLVQRDKALRHVGDCVAVLDALRSDPAIRAAAMRTLYLLGVRSVFDVYAFGPAAHTAASVRLVMGEPQRRPGPCPGYAGYCEDFYSTSVEAGGAPTEMVVWAQECVRLGACFHADIRAVEAWLESGI